MKSIFIVAFTLLSISQVVVTVGDHTFFATLDSPDWCYNVPSCNELTWKGSCNSDCHQSPIDLPANLSTVQFHREVVHNFPRSQLNFDKFNIDFRGHTIQIKPSGEPFRFTREVHGNHTINYTLHGLDLHWGSNNSVGSEHTIDGVPFSGEVHLAFHDPTSFTPEDLEDTEDMVKKAGDLGILIIGVFLQAAKEGEDDSTVKQNVSSWMQPIVDKTVEIQNYNPLLVREELDLKDLFQDFAAYRYPGSFTTPSCRAVEWWIIRTPLLVPADHMDALRNAFVDGVPIDGNNYRLTKPNHDGDISLIRLEYA